MSRIHEMHEAMLKAAYTDNAQYPVMSVDGTRQIDNDLVQRQPYLLGSANLTLTAAMSGSIIRCGAAEDYVLPALTASEVGVTYEFLVTTTATSLTITASSGDLLEGGVSINSTTAGGADAFSADGSDDLIISMNGTTTGGIVGSWVKLTAASATSWLVRGVLIGSGTLATPFS